MLVRYDPFRDFDRKTSRRQWMPMDACRHDQLVELRFDVPGIAPDSLDVEVERNVLTVRAERSGRRRRVTRCWRRSARRVPSPAR
jgi:HSP20 family protein